MMMIMMMMMIMIHARKRTHTCTYTHMGTCSASIFRSRLARVAGLVILILDFPFMVLARVMTFVWCMKEVAPVFLLYTKTVTFCIIRLSWHTLFVRQAIWYCFYCWIFLFSFIILPYLLSEFWFIADRLSLGLVYEVGSIGAYSLQFFGMVSVSMMHLSTLLRDSLCRSSCSGIGCLSGARDVLGVRCYL